MNQSTNVQFWRELSDPNGINKYILFFTSIKTDERRKLSEVIFSSPDPKCHVTYCDHLATVILLLNFTF
jgi:hypothetical protein